MIISITVLIFSKHSKRETGNFNLSTLLYPRDGKMCSDRDHDRWIWSLLHRSIVREYDLHDKEWFFLMRHDFQIDNSKRILSESMKYPRWLTVRRQMNPDVHVCHWLLLFRWPFLMWRKKKRESKWQVSPSGKSITIYSPDANKTLTTVVEGHSQSLRSRMILFPISDEWGKSRKEASSQSP